MRHFGPRLATLVALVAIVPPATASVIEEAPVSADSGMQVSPQAAYDPSNASHSVVAATDYGGDGVTPRTAVWHNSGSGFTRSDPGLPAGVSSRGSASASWGPSGGNDVWVSHMGADGGTLCSSTSGVFLSHSGDGGSSWDSGFLALPNFQGPTNKRRFESADVVGDAHDGSQAPILVGSYETFGAAGCATPTGNRVLIAGPGADANGFQLEGGVPGDARYPSAVSIPDPSVPRVTIAYLDPVASRIEISRCSATAFGPLWNWACSLAGALPSFTPVSTLDNGSGPDLAISSAPDLARGPDGTLHVVYTVQHGADTDVLYSSSTDGGTTWSTPRSVADPAAEGADQLMPAVAVSPALAAPVGEPGVAGGRVEVAFLDRRADGVRLQPYVVARQSWSDGVDAWGANRPLDGAPAAAPTRAGGAIADLGDRIDVAATAPTLAAPSGPGIVWWPSTRLDPAGDLLETRLDHGSTTPSLASTLIATSKNVTVPVADLLASPDDDGDPVRVTITRAPESGAFAGGIFTPAPGFAGDDQVTVRAQDGHSTNTVTRAIRVSNNRPDLPDGSLLSVPQGASLALQLGASDPDPGDSLSYSLTGDVPAVLAGGLSVTPSGVLTVAPSATSRSATIVQVHVRVSDSSPSIGGTDEATIPVKIVPTYTPIAVSLGAPEINGNAVKFDAEVLDLDQEAGQRTPTYRWDFGDGSQSSPNEKDPQHGYPGPGTYTYTVSVTMPREEGVAAAVVATGTFTIKPSGVTAFATRTYTVQKQRHRLMLRLQPRATYKIRIAVRSGALKTPPVDVVLKGRVKRTIYVNLRPLGLKRSADVIITFLPPPLAGGPLPTPVSRKITLR